MLQDHIFPIIGKVFSRPYNWGGTQLIPQTLGFTPEPDTPYAEYWLGVHKKAPAQVMLANGDEQGLDQLIKDNPEEILGSEIASRIGTLPFLFKLLDAKEMLSIQVHPNKKQAEEGFEEENNKGIDLTDPKRTYLDSNHKREFCVAMNDFWLIHGFRQKESLETILQEIKEFASLADYFQDGNYEKLYRHVMIEMDDNEANDILNKLAQRIIPQYESGQLQKEHPDYWAAKAIKYMHMQAGSYDRGLFSIYFLNLIHLKPGEAMFQDAGILHAYLEGPIIEIMTTSDNVARGGITSKYVNVEELMKLVKFAGVTPEIITGRKVADEDFYDSPCDEFLLSKISPTEDRPYKNTSHSAEIVMGFAGNAKLITNGKELPLSKGKSNMIFAKTEYQIVGSENDVVFRTSVPVSK